MHACKHGCHRISLCACSYTDTLILCKIFGRPYLSDSMQAKLSEKSHNTPYCSTYATTHACTPRTHATVPWEHCFRCDTRVPPDGNRTRAGKLAHLASCQPSYGSFACQFALITAFVYLATMLRLTYQK